MTPNESSPIVPMSGRNVVSFFERSRTNTALPFFPLPRSDTFRMANRSSSVVPTMWNRCGFAASWNTSSSADCGVPTLWKYTWWFSFDDESSVPFAGAGYRL